MALLANGWQAVAPGIEYQDLGTKLLNPWSHIYVFRVDPKQNQLESILATELSRPHASIEEFSNYSKPLIALNGGFFDRRFHPLGLRLSNHKQMNPLKRISWWGVFYIERSEAYISSYKAFKKNKAISFALQSGPRLIINKKIPSLKPGVAERSALGITEDNQVIILVTDNTPMSTTDLAQLMRSEPLNCVNALNLDGGNSSQLKVTLNNLELNVHGFSQVSDAIIVKPITSDAL